MNKFFISLMLLLGISMFLSSCNHDEGDSTKVDTEKIEGRWWIVNEYELFFNGEIMKHFSNKSDWLDMNLHRRSDLQKLYFDNGSATFILNDDSARESYAYSLIDNIITILWGQFNVLKLKGNELILESHIDDSLFYFTSGLPDKEFMVNPITVDTFRGIKIYTYSGNSDFEDICFWYYDKNNNARMCKFHGEIERKSGGWSINCDYWFDAERYYFKAE